MCVLRIYRSHCGILVKIKKKTTRIPQKYYYKLKYTSDVCFSRLLAAVKKRSCFLTCLVRSRCIVNTMGPIQNARYP